MKVFIGSSREQTEEIDKIAGWLEEFNVDSVLWTDDNVFRAGRFTWEELCNISKDVDAAIFVFGADDKTWYRGEEHISVRDNILLEFGLFTGSISRGNVIFACKNNPKIATDLHGLTCIDLNRERLAKSKIREWIKVVENTIEKNEEINKGIFNIMDLSDAFHICFQNKKVKTLKIFAISTFKSVQTLRLINNLEIDTAHIILRKYENNDKYYEENMENSINIAINSWKYMVENKNIRTLKLSRFDYHPDEGFYIIDDRFLIMGYLNFDVLNKKSEFANQVILIDNTTLAGQCWIKEYTKRFDKIEGNYETETIQ